MEHGQQEYGATLIVVEGSMAGQVFLLEYEVHVIGRGEEADLVVLDPEISRMHARLKRHENHYIIEDLRSANGCWINDARVEGRQLLLPGDRLRLGQTELIIRYSTALI
jgi:pSer/pThr/pTyr-binding forkhead associated (FHA) protein